MKLVVVGLVGGDRLMLGEAVGVADVVCSCLPCLVVLWATPSAQQLSQPGSYLNQATGQADPNGQKTGVTDWNEVFKHSYETWGRKVDLVFVKATGADEASQRADAVAVAAMKPFAVYDVSMSEWRRDPAIPMETGAYAGRRPASPDGRTQPQASATSRMRSARMKR